MQRAKQGEGIACLEERRKGRRSVTGQKFLDTIKRAESTEDHDSLHVEHVVGKGREGVGTS